MMAIKHFLIQKNSKNFKQGFCHVAWWCFCLEMRFRVGDSEQFRILDVDNSSYAMIQNRHQATHTKEPLLIIAIKIQQHFRHNAQPQPLFYASKWYLSYKNTNCIKILIFTTNIKSNNYLTWSAWYLLLPSFHVMMQSRTTAGLGGSQAEHWSSCRLQTLTFTVSDYQLSWWNLL